MFLKVGELVVEGAIAPPTLMFLKVGELVVEGAIAPF